MRKEEYSLIRKRILAFHFNYNEKTPSLSQQGFFFVDKWFEISNQELIRDMERLMKLSEVLPEQSVSIMPRI